MIILLNLIGGVKLDKDLWDHRDTTHVDIATSAQGSLTSVYSLYFCGLIHYFTVAYSIDLRVESSCLKAQFKIY
jgi:hypothetical protein